jgi:hypothetical protein
VQNRTPFGLGQLVEGFGVEPVSEVAEGSLKAVITFVENVCVNPEIQSIDARTGSLSTPR